MVDDLIAYVYDEDRVLLVPNAANTAEVVRRLAAAAPAGVTVTDEHRDHAVLAVQGTKSDEVLAAIGLPVGHDYMSFAVADLRGRRRGGLPHRLHRRARLRADRPQRRRRRRCGTRIMAAGEPYGVLPCGLGARDTLRTEMGYPLHGQDISLDVTPNQARLGWAVGWKKDAFWGREVLTAEREAGPERVLRGLVATGRGIPRPHMTVSLTADVPLGEVTSGTFSPTLRKGIGLALVPAFVDPDAEVGVDIRGRREIFQLVKPPFLDPSVREA